MASRAYQIPLEVEVGWQMASTRCKKGDGARKLRPLPVPLAEMSDAYWNRQRQGRLPERQFGLLCWPTASDPALAPEGHHVLNFILQGPYQLVDSDWEREKPAFIERAIAHLAENAVPGLAEHIQVTELSTPPDLERRLRLPGGAFYGLQQDLSAQAVLRPRAKSRAVEGLYLCGASTHPGGGVPTTIASGLNAVTLIERYEG